VWTYIHATYGKQLRMNTDEVFHLTCLFSFKPPQAEVFLTYIREVSGLNFRRYTECPYWKYSSSSSVPPSTQRVLHKIRP